MEEQNIRIALDRHWAASAAGDQGAEHEIYHDDAVCEYPQSGEVIRGRRNLTASEPSSGTTIGVRGPANRLLVTLGVTEYVITDQGKRLHSEHHGISGR